MATAGYVNVGNIASMITRSNKNLTLDLYDVVEWCADVIGDAGVYETYTPVKGEEYVVTNKQILLPCRLVRLVAVRRGNCLMAGNEFTRSGPYLQFNLNENNFKVNIDYLSIPVDESGFPLIPNTHRQACYWYCLTKVYLEDFLNGKITADRYALMENKYIGYLIESKQRFDNVTVNDEADISAIVHNMVMSVRPPASIP